jgi:hypothetical protein
LTSWAKQPGIEVRALSDRCDEAAMATTYVGGVRRCFEFVSRELANRFEHYEALAA